MKLCDYLISSVLKLVIFFERKFIKIMTLTTISFILRFLFIYSFRVGLCYKLSHFTNIEVLSHGLIFTISDFFYIGAICLITPVLIFWVREKISTVFVHFILIVIKVTFLGAFLFFFLFSYFYLEISKYVY